ncbi:MAG: GNAT family N-acetyltransferase [Candidatus Eisenbacteria bacterium]
MAASARLVLAAPEDVPALVDLHGRVARDLTRRFGEGHWSSEPTERGILFHLRMSRIFVVRNRGKIIATLRLTTRRPWAIDPSFFTPCKRPLYLLDMAVEPGKQGTGLGARCVALVPAIARAWPADAIRLDAYDGPAGAGPFYVKCGYREVGRVSYRGTALVYYEQGPRSS